MKNEETLRHFLDAVSIGNVSIVARPALLPIWNRHETVFSHSLRGLIWSGQVPQVWPGRKGQKKVK